jgi:hypothetical protein
VCSDTENFKYGENVWSGKVEKAMKAEPVPSIVQSG